jgi:outer membrane protein assembly factor BamD (BamD/ComL family)
MPRPILPRQQHLDIANQLMASKQYTAAAAAYEVFLETYPTYEHLADIQLMLGIVYGRYLHETSRAISLLETAAKGLTDPASIEMANDERRALER